MGRGAVADPLKSFRFRVEIDGFIRFGFSKVSGLNVETDVIEYREGGDNETPQKSPGLAKYGDVTLSRGQIVPGPGADDFLNWFAQVHKVAVQGSSAEFRREPVIHQYNSLNQKVRSWKLNHAWPKSYKPMGDVDAQSSENSVEELVLAHEGFELIL